MTDTKKRNKAEKFPCIICGQLSSPEELSRLTGASSWRTLPEAARIRNFEPLLRIAVEDDKNFVPDILYHNTCRSDFTHKKGLTKLLKDHDESISEHTCNEMIQSKRHKTSATSRVYEKICIFCEKQSKYVKGSFRL